MKKSSSIDPKLPSTTPQTPKSKKMQCSDHVSPVNPLLSGTAKFVKSQTQTAAGKEQVKHIRDYKK